MEVVNVEVAKHTVRVRVCHYDRYTIHVCGHTTKVCMYM